MTARLTAGHCVWLYSVSNLPPNKRAQSSLRIWPVTDSHLPCHPICLRNKRARQTTSTPTTAPARLALRSNVLSGLAEKFAEAGLLVSSNAKPMAWPGLILSGFVWPDPVCGLSNTWPVMILYVACLIPGLFSCWRVACQVMACSGSVRGLSGHGLFWFLIWFCSVLSDT